MTLLGFIPLVLLAMDYITQKIEMTVCSSSFMANAFFPPSPSHRAIAKTGKANVGINGNNERGKQLRCLMYKVSCHFLSFLFKVISLDSGHKDNNPTSVIQRSIFCTSDMSRISGQLLRWWPVSWNNCVMEQLCHGTTRWILFGISYSSCRWVLFGWFNLSACLYDCN